MNFDKEKFKKDILNSYCNCACGQLTADMLPIMDRAIDDFSNLMSDYCEDMVSFCNEMDCTPYTVFKIRKDL